MAELPCGRAHTDSFGGRVIAPQTNGSHISHPVGAYGLEITGVPGGEEAGLLPLPPEVDWPRLEVSWSSEMTGRPATTELRDGRAIMLMIEQGWADIDLPAGRAVIHDRGPMTPDDLVHPFMTPAAAIMAMWHGRAAIHGGGVIVDGEAWGLLGDREAGKTTLMAWLHRSGFGILADDLVVLADGEAYSGPRGLDLRPATAERLSDGEDVKQVRGGERGRLVLPAVAPVVPIRGWVRLEVGPEVEIVEAPLGDRMPILSSQVMKGPGTAERLLDLLAMPMLVLRRPLTWQQLPEVAERLVEALRRVSVFGGLSAPGHGGAPGTP
jgi:hypothetical protein